MADALARRVGVGGGAFINIERKKVPPPPLNSNVLGRRWRSFGAPPYRDIQKAVRLRYQLGVGGIRPMDIPKPYSRILAS